MNKTSRLVATGLLGLALNACGEVKQVVSPMASRVDTLETYFDTVKSPLEFTSGKYKFTLRLERGPGCEGNSFHFSGKGPSRIEYEDNHGKCANQYSDINDHDVLKIDGKEMTGYELSTIPGIRESVVQWYADAAAQAKKVQEERRLLVQRALK